MGTEATKENQDLRVLRVLRVLCGDSAPLQTSERRFSEQIESPDVRTLFRLDAKETTDAIRHRRSTAARRASCGKRAGRYAGAARDAGGLRASLRRSERHAPSLCERRQG